MDLGDRIRWLGQHRLLHAAGLLVERGWLQPEVGDLGVAMRDHFVAEERSRTAAERQVLEALANAGVDALVLKGALLAHMVYPTPESRFRGDLDVLVPEIQVERSEAALKAIGMHISFPGGASPPIPQRQWVFADAPVGFAVDLHWALSNHPGLRQILSFAELAEEAHLVPGLGQRARGLSRVHALLHACIHYYGHHCDEFKPLQWLLDMDLLWRAMVEQERLRAVELSIEKGIAGLVVAGLREAVEHFATPIESSLLDRLEDAGRRQPTTRLLKGSRSYILGKLGRAAWAPGIRGKLRMLRAILFPPADFMYVKYPEGSRLGLPGMWLRRFVDALRPR